MSNAENGRDVGYYAGLVEKQAEATMIGLQRGTVQLRPYSPNWAESYGVECQRLTQASGRADLRIAHIGSTAVPDLAAKPIIDIAIEVPTLADIEALVAPFNELGYQYFGERHIRGDYFFAKGAEHCRTHYLHVSLPDSHRFEHYLIFRDALLSDVALREAYQQRKETLAKQFADDRRTYTEQKGELIERVLAQFMNRANQ
ncbi:MAG: GrpB family protein [Reinekea sp.]|nr:GrpB family protein [Reinekea sp.]